jgi:hypothetical protein
VLFMCQDLKFFSPCRYFCPFRGQEESETIATDIGGNLLTSHGRRRFYRRRLRCCIIVLRNHQDRQFRGDVTLRSVRATIIAVEQKLSLHILSAFCGLRYPACNAHASYCLFAFVFCVLSFASYGLDGQRIK